MMWSDKTTMYVNNILYKYVQFLNTSAENNYGGMVQKIVCNKLSIPVEHSEMFWNHYGSIAVYNAIKRKRQTIGTAMKLLFISKWKTLHALLFQRKILTVMATCLEHCRNGRIPVRPRDFLGDVEIVQDDDLVLEECLRNTQDINDENAYVRFLHMFGQALFHSSEWKRSCTLEDSLDFLPVNLEAFGVLVYENNYNYWWNKYARHHFPNVDNAREETDNPLTHSRPRFTFDPLLVHRGGGWTQEGMQFYNRLALLITKQREMPQNRNFDRKLKTYIRASVPNNRRTANNTTNVVEATNNLGILANFLEI